MAIIIVTMPDESKWSVDPNRVAEDRANYYAGIDRFPRGSQRWQDEVKLALSDWDELLDWIKNDMNWDELDAQMITKPKSPNYSEWFIYNSVINVSEEETSNESPPVDK